MRVRRERRYHRAEMEPGVYEAEQAARHKRTTRNVLLIAGCAVIGGFLLLFLAVLLPVFVQARQAAKLALCRADMYILGQAVLAYAEAHGGKLPAAATWQDELKPHLHEPYEQVQCRDDQVLEPGGIGISLNSDVAGKPLASLSPETVVLFQSEAKRPNGSEPYREPSVYPPRYRAGYVVLQADGHARVVRRPSTFP